MLSVGIGWSSWSSPLTLAPSSTHTWCWRYTWEAHFQMEHFIHDTRNIHLLFSIEGRKASNKLSSGIWLNSTKSSSVLYPILWRIRTDGSLFCSSLLVSLTDEGVPLLNRWLGIGNLEGGYTLKLWDHSMQVRLVDCECGCNWPLEIWSLPHLFDPTIIIHR